MCVREDVFVYCVAGESVLRMRAPCTVRWKSPFLEMYQKQPNHVQTSLLLKHSTKYMPLNLGD